MATSLDDRATEEGGQSRILPTKASGIICKLAHLLIRSQLTEMLKQCRGSSFSVMGERVITITGWSGKNFRRQTNSETQSPITDTVCDGQNPLLFLLLLLQ